MHGKPFPRWLSIAILLAIATTFGSNHIAARVAFDHGVSVTTAVAARSLGAALFVLVLLLTSRVPLALPAATRWRAIGIGVLIAVQSYCIYSAVARIPVALALLAFNTFPMMFSLISWVTGGERPARRALIAMPVALCGLALALDALAAFDLVPASLATHALTVGAIGGMTIGMMTRTSRGHTGRPLQAGLAEVSCYVTIQFAALTRVFLPLVFPPLYLHAVIVSGLLWSLAFGVFTIAYWPILSRPRADGRPG